LPEDPALASSGTKRRWTNMHSSDVSDRVYSTEKLAREFTAALDADRLTVIVVRTQPQQAHLG
jgi:hypothetical protein